MEALVEFQRQQVADQRSLRRSIRGAILTMVASVGAWATIQIAAHYWADATLQASVHHTITQSVGPAVTKAVAPAVERAVRQTVPAAVNHAVATCLNNVPACSGPTK